MNYINAMKNLKQIEQDMVSVNREHTDRVRFVEHLGDMKNIAGNCGAYHISDTVNALAHIYGSDGTPKLHEDVKWGCEQFGIPYSESLKTKTCEYESKMRAIRSAAKAEIEKSKKANPSMVIGKIIGLYFSGAGAFCGIVLPFILKEVYEGSIFEDTLTFFPMIGVACLILFISLLKRQKKTNINKLNELVNEIKGLTNDYVDLTYPIFSKALASLEIENEEKLLALTNRAKAEVGEAVYEIYENVPLGQREYFRELGMSASCEDDFKDILKQCIIANKQDMQISLQNYMAQERNKELNDNIKKLTKTANDIREDARMHAAQAAEQNERLARQNEKNLKNQSKANDALRKQNDLISDFEYRMRHKD